MQDILKLHQRFCDFSLAFKGNTPRAISWFQQCIMPLLRFSEASRIEELNRHVIEDWIMKGKLERKWSAKTIRNMLQGVSIFFDWCVKEGYIQENPTKDIPRPRLPKQIPKHLNKNDALTLLDWARNFPYHYQFEKKRAVAIIATFIFTGVRLQELKNLQIEDIDLLHRTLLVKGGKGQKDRIIPINYQLIQILEEYLKDRNRMKKACPYFFTAMRQDSKMSDMVIKRLVEKLRERSGIHFYPHLLRHTFATLMLEGGCDLFSLSKMMGHSDIKTTTIYLSATTAHLQEQILKHPLSI